MRAYEARIVGGARSPLAALSACRADEDKGGNHQIWQPKGHPELRAPLSTLVGSTQIS
jgi:hypothetical protein